MMSDKEVNEEVLDEIAGGVADKQAETRNEHVEVEVSEAAAESMSEESDMAEQLRAAEDRVLRAQAELENFRIRVRRETEDQLKHANQPLLVDLLPVIDNIYRAVDAATQDEAASGLLTGVSMVAQQLMDTLGKYHCRRIEAVGSPFDPNLHEAVQQMPSDEFEAGVVIQVLQEGYMLHDRVIRPSQVIISTGAAN